MGSGVQHGCLKVTGGHQNSHLLSLSDKDPSVLIFNLHENQQICTKGEKYPDHDLHCVTSSVGMVRFSMIAGMQLWLRHQLVMCVICITAELTEDNIWMDDFTFSSLTYICWYSFITVFFFKSIVFQRFNYHNLWLAGFEHDDL